MTAQPSLTKPEWELVMELLERERYELPAEIHHTRTSQMRDELKQRLELVNALLRRLRDQAAAPGV
jgi:hypothetical protein